MKQSDKLLERAAVTALVENPFLAVPTNYDVPGTGDQMLENMCHRRLHVRRGKIHVSGKGWRSEKAIESPEREEGL